MNRSMAMIAVTALLGACTGQEAPTGVVPSREPAPGEPASTSVPTLPPPAAPETCKLGIDGELPHTSTSESCAADEYRCVGLKKERCDGGRWAPGCGQECCRTYGRFSTLSCGSVLDTSTGLVWARNDDQSIVACDAVTYCASLKTDNAAWRAPTVSELSTLLLGGQPTCYPAIDQVAFPNAISWQASASDGSVDFFSGTSSNERAIDLYPAKEYGLCSVRCVRQSVRSHIGH